MARFGLSFTTHFIICATLTDRIVKLSRGLKCWGGPTSVIVEEYLTPHQRKKLHINISEHKLIVGDQTIYTSDPMMLEKVINIVKSYFDIREAHAWRPA